MKKRGQIATWVGLWCFWAILSRNNHPTLVLDGIATALLLSAYAGAVYINEGLLIPKYWRSRRFLVYGACLLLTLCVLTVLVVLAIQKVYDLLWGPDPRRFGFWTNCGLDFVGMIVHMVAAAVVVSRLRRRSSYRNPLARD